MPPTPTELFTNAEILELQKVIQQHSGAPLSIVDTQVVAHQLLRLLHLIRTVAIQSSTDTASPVDERSLPNAPIRGITTSPTD